MLLLKPSMEQAEQLYSLFYKEIHLITHKENHRFKRHQDNERHLMECAGLLNLITGIRGIPLTFTVKDNHLDITPMTSMRETAYELYGIKRAFRKLYRHKHRLRDVIR